MIYEGWFGEWIQLKTIYHTRKQHLDGMNPSMSHRELKATGLAHLNVALYPTTIMDDKREYMSQLKSRER